MSSPIKILLPGYIKISWSEAITKSSGSSVFAFIYVSVESNINFLSSANLISPSISKAYEGEVLFIPTFPEK